MKRRFSPPPVRRTEPTHAERSAAVALWLEREAAKHRAAARSFACQPDNAEAVEAETRHADVLEAAAEVLRQNQLLAPVSATFTSNQERRG